MHEEVKADCVLAAAVIRAVQQRDELRAQAVSKGDQGLVEFRIRYAARVVGVEAVEEAAPGAEEAPEAAGKSVSSSELLGHVLRFGKGNMSDWDSLGRRDS